MAPRRLTRIGVLQMLWLAACSPGSSPAPEAGTARFEIQANGLSFQAPAVVPAGWVTMELTNQSGMEHFAIVQRLPDGKGIDDHQEQVAPVFQSGMNLLAAGKREAGFGEFEKLPDWYRDVRFLGGPGLVSGGLSTRVTMDLEPGTYLLECYVKTGGVFHSFNASPGKYGMVHEFEVVAEGPREAEPIATFRVSVSGEFGIQTEGTPSSGDHTIAIAFLDQSIHENAVGHDLHLARLQEDTDLENLGKWMDWTRPGGLQTPAPAVFVGGVNEMPSGQTAYLDVHLEPGRYAWISEVPDPDAKNLLKTFVVH